MTDTPEHIKQLQLDIWLSKPPMERLLQFLKDNETLYNFWKENKTMRGENTNLENINAEADQPKPL